MRTVDLFCGAGGLSQGLTEAGFTVVGAYDNWSAAVETYEWNLQHAVNIDCVNLLEVDNVVRQIKRLDVDVIAGGPPCQDFSSAGKRLEGRRASLTEAFAEIVVACKPFLVIMENVPRVRSSQAYKNARQLLEKTGYSFFERVLNANQCGVPQIRNRFFMVAWLTKRKELCELMEGRVNEALIQKTLTVSEYMKDEISIEHYYRHPRNYCRRAIFSVNEPSPTIRGVNRLVPPNYKRNHLDTADPAGVRALTSYERSRIQTFPKTWRWNLGENSRTKTDVELLIGNAAPINLSRFVGQAALGTVV